MKPPTADRQAVGLAGISLPIQLGRHFYAGRLPDMRRDYGDIIGLQNAGFSPENAREILIHRKLAVILGEIGDFCPKHSYSRHWKTRPNLPYCGFLVHVSLDTRKNATVALGLGDDGVTTPLQNTAGK